MRPLTFALGLALAAGAEAHTGLAPLIVQGAIGVAFIWIALHWRTT